MTTTNTSAGLRPVLKVNTAHRQREGAGFIVRRPFPSGALAHADPFLMLDEMGPTEYGPGEAVGAPDHPHRGFETVTYMPARAGGRVWTVRDEHARADRRGDPGLPERADGRDRAVGVAREARDGARADTAGSAYAAAPAGQLPGAASGAPASPAGAAGVSTDDGTGALT